MKRLLAFLLLAVLVLSLSACGRRNTDALTVVVEISGRTVARLPLKEDTELEITGVGGTNHLIIREGAAWISSADCKNQICVNTGRIDGKSLLGMITCLPHEVVVYLEEKP